MLPQNYRFYIINNTGVTIQFGDDDANNTFTIKGEAWKFVDGVPDYSTEITFVADPSSNLADGATLVGTSIDNSTNLYIGLHALAALLTDAATDGTLDIYIEFSPDGGTTWPSSANDFDIEEDLIPVAKIKCGTTTEDKSVNIAL